jgi:hypothetical protein
VAIDCGKGIRKGDPLSPSLFVLATYLLQSMKSKTMQFGYIERPYPIVSYIDFM